MRKGELKWWVLELLAVILAIFLISGMQVPRGTGEPGWTDFGSPPYGRF